VHRQHGVKGERSFEVFSLLCSVTVGPDTVARPEAHESPAHHTIHYPARCFTGETAV
jgi:hypothetical protein